MLLLRKLAGTQLVSIYRIDNSTREFDPLMFEQFCSTCSVYRLQPQHRLQEIDTKWLLNIIQNAVIIQSLLQIAVFEDLEAMTAYIQFI